MRDGYLAEMKKRREGMGINKARGQSDWRHSGYKQIDNTFAGRYRMTAAVGRHKTMQYNNICHDRQKDIID